MNLCERYYLFSESSSMYVFLGIYHSTSSCVADLEHNHFYSLPAGPFLFTWAAAAEQHRSLGEARPRCRARVSNAAKVLLKDVPITQIPR